MNGYYTREQECHIRKESAAARAGARADRILDALFALVALIIGALRDRKVRTVIRYSAVTICFFCFVGLIGGMEQGLVSIGGGIALGLLLIFVEIFCLR